MATIQATLAKTALTIAQADSRQLGWIPAQSVHLVLTSPPYWTLKDYPPREGQLGLVEDYEFISELDKVCGHCFRALVAGGRLVCVAGDVARRAASTAGIRSYRCTQTSS